MGICFKVISGLHRVEAALLKQVSQTRESLTTRVNAMLEAYLRPVNYVTSPIGEIPLKTILMMLNHKNHEGQETLKFESENLRMAVCFFLLRLESMGSQISEWREDPKCPDEIKALIVPKQDGVSFLVGRFGFKPPYASDEFELQIRQICLKTQAVALKTQPSSNSVGTSSKLSRRESATNMSNLEKLYTDLSTAWGLQDATDHELTTLYTQLRDHSEATMREASHYVDAAKRHIYERVKHALESVMDISELTFQKTFPPDFYSHIRALIKEFGQEMVETALQEKINARELKLQELRLKLVETSTMTALQAQLEDVTYQLQQAQQNVTRLEMALEHNPQTDGPFTTLDLQWILPQLGLSVSSDEAVESIEQASGTEDLGLAEFQEEEVAGDGGGNQDLSDMASYLLLTEQHSMLESHLTRLRERYDRLTQSLMQARNFGNLEATFFEQTLKAFKTKQSKEKAVLQALISDINRSRELLYDMLRRSEKSSGSMALRIQKLEAALESAQTEAANWEAQYEGERALAQRTATEREERLKLKISAIQNRAREEYDELFAEHQANFIKLQTLAKVTQERDELRTGVAELERLFRNSLTFIDINGLSTAFTTFTEENANPP